MKKKTALKKIICLGVCLVLVIAIGLMLCGCSGGGLAEAYEKLPEIQGDLSVFEYEKDSDTLIIQLDEYDTDVDEFFDIIDEAVKGCDIGTLSFRGNLEAVNHEAYMRTLDKRLGELPCKSIKRLDVGPNVYEMEGQWTKLLEKTDELYMYEGYFEGYSKVEGKYQKNLGKVQSIAFYENLYEKAVYDISELSAFSGVKSITFSAGLTKEEQKETANKGFLFEYDYSDLKCLADMSELETVLFFPEIDSWTPGSEYYNYILALQQVVPNVKTNKAGELYNEETLTAVKNIDVLSIATGESRDKALEVLLADEPKECYEKGIKFEMKSGKPELTGKCLVYVAYPFEEQWNKDIFYDMAPSVVISELSASNIALPEKPGDYDTFVYIYPKYSQTGTYDSGTKAYVTKTMLQVFDIKNGVRYEPVTIDEQEPPQSFTHYGAAPNSYCPNMKPEKAFEYLKGL
ncbi:MAG: hypothetical protein GX663_02830 [Clostridiales bacterium]|nr:hypothetical protein [Clostridiales bacterium]